MFLARSMFRSAPVAALVLVLAISAALLGCSGYELRGWVVQGEYGDVTIIDRDDPRIEEAQAVANAEIALSRDPGTLGEEIVARTRSDAEGAFRLPVESFGAGWMDEQWRIQSAAAGHRNVDVVLRLPNNPNRRRVLITLPTGTPQPIQGRPDLTEEFERYR